MSATIESASDPIDIDTNLRKDRHRFALGADEPLDRDAVAGGNTEQKAAGRRPRCRPVARNNGRGQHTRDRQAPPDLENGVRHPEPILASGDAAGDYAADRLRVE